MWGLPQRRLVRGLPMFTHGSSLGFQPRIEFIHAFYNRILGLVALAATLPLMLVISFLLLVTQGPKIFYRGSRLGRNGRIFHIYKFRTLQADAARKLTRTRTLPDGTGIETPLGRVLRSNRLDELPQILNVVFGSMNICGPRPVRPEIAEIERGRIKDYDLRFTVKPGLIGPAQACISHGTSKRIRARVNNRLCRRPVSYLAELRLMAVVGAAVVKRTFWSRTASEEAAPEVVWMTLPDRDDVYAVSRLGRRTLHVSLLGPTSASCEATLRFRLRNCGIRKARIILVESEKMNLFTYTAVNEVSEFIIERYGLGLTVVAPQLYAPRPAASLSLTPMIFGGDAAGTVRPMSRGKDSSVA
jgi:lipopolysaccharide/colanic/teichoic acid biosynthesis glycosyltransferase